MIAPLRLRAGGVGRKIAAMTLSRTVRAVLLLALATLLVRVAHAQPPAPPVAGYMSVRSPEDTAELLTAFREGLAEHGFVEPRTVTIEYRWARGHNDRLPQLAAELVRRPVGVLVTTGGEAAALAAKAATRTIPIVFSVGRDPVKLGLVASYNRPGGNITGVNILAATLEAKRIELLHDLLPQATALGLVVHPDNPAVERQIHDAEAAARRLDLQLQVVRVRTDGDIDVVFKALARQHVAAVAVTAGPFFDTRRPRLVAAAAQHRVPAIYAFREFPDTGGLMSYGVDPAETSRDVGRYVGRILKGAKPGEQPVLEPTKFELVINLKAAQALGLAIPAAVRVRADRLID